MRTRLLITRLMEIVGACPTAAAVATTLRTSDRGGLLGPPLSEQARFQLAARHIERKRDADIHFAKSARQRDRINDFQTMVLTWLAHVSHDCAARILGSQHLPSSVLQSTSWEEDLQYALYGLSVQLLYPVMATVPVKRTEEAVDAHGLGAVVGGQSRDMATAPTLLALKALASELNEGGTLAGCVARDFVQRLGGAGPSGGADSFRALTDEVEQALNPWLVQWNNLVKAGVAEARSPTG